MNLEIKTQDILCFYFITMQNSSRCGCRLTVFAVKYSRQLLWSAEEACEALCRKTSSTRRTVTEHELIKMFWDAWRNLSEYECMYWHLFTDRFLRDDECQDSLPPTASGINNIPTGCSKTWSAKTT